MWTICRLVCMSFQQKSFVSLPLHSFVLISKLAFHPSLALGWSGVLSIHKGYWQGAILHFTLLIPSTYPQSPPQVIFDSPIFHPLIDPVSGRMRLDSRFPHWRPREDFIWTVLHFVKSAFKRRGLDELREAVCANQEAYRL